MLHDETVSASVTLRTGLSYSSAKRGALKKGKPRVFTNREDIQFFLGDSRFEVTQFGADGSKLFVPSPERRKLTPASIKKVSIAGDGWPVAIQDDKAQLEAAKKLKEAEEAWLKEEAEAAKSPPKVAWKTSMSKDALSKILAGKLQVTTVPEMTKRELISALEEADAK